MRETFNPFLVSSWLKTFFLAIRPFSSDRLNFCKAHSDFFSSIPAMMPASLLIKSSFHSSFAIFQKIGLGVCKNYTIVYITYI